MANVTLSLTPDCRVLSYTLQGINSEILENEGVEEAQSISDQATVEIYNNGILSTTQNPTLLTVEDTGSYVNTNVVIVPEIIGNDPGVITVLMQDPAGNRASAAILVSCELDCCLADKVLDLTKCTDCNPKCSEKLAISQKIFLYMESIKTMLSQLGDDITINEGIISQAIDTYTAAKELCAGSCGCNC
jgi:hypothetical protein